MTLAATTAAGFFVVVTVLLSSEPGFAQGVASKRSAVELPPAVSRGPIAPEAEPKAGSQSGDRSGGSCACPNAAPSDPMPRDKLWPKPALADLKATLDDTDAVAALEALQLALTEVSDGATYIWHRKHGRLSGAIQPTTSFKDASGQVCRHIVMALTSGSYSRKAEGIACRRSTGTWLLEG